MIPPEYSGREQTFIKHAFLTNYLELLAFKTLQGRDPIFNFVDAFAGPWRIANDSDYSDASFDQALRTLNGVKSKLKELGKSSTIRFIFCEKNKASFERLEEYSHRHKEYEIRIFHGRFEENLENINAFCNTGFTFTFIDPTGWNIDSKPIFEFLRQQNGEFLINFMSEDINRFATYHAVSSSIGHFLADSNWENDFNQLSTKSSNEERVLSLLKKQIKDSKAAMYVPDFPILKPKENRIKMRLLLGTNSSKALEVFRDVQKPVENLEIKARTRLRNKGQQSLFDEGDISDFIQSLEGIGSEEYRKRAEEKIAQFLTENGSSRFENIKILILEKIPIRLTQLKDLISLMRKQNILLFDLPKRKQKPQDDTIISLAKRQKTLF